MGFYLAIKESEKGKVWRLQVNGWKWENYTEAIQA